MSIESLITSGRIADIILIVLVLEAIWVRFLVTKDMKRYPTYIAGLAAGACLVLALRAALTDTGWVYVAIFLTLSLFAHVAELGIRLFRKGS